MADNDLLSEMRASAGEPQDILSELEAEGWETADTGSFLSFGDEAGQEIFGKVTKFDLTGGKDFNGNVALALGVELAKETYSEKKDGTRTDFDAGDGIEIQGPPAVLDRKLKALVPAAGDVIYILSKGLVKTKTGRMAKDFDVKLKRNTPKLGSLESAA